MHSIWMHWLWPSWLFISNNYKLLNQDVTSQTETEPVCFSSTLEEYRQQEEKLTAELQHGRQRSEEVNQELGQVLEELGNARLDSQESSWQKQRKELLEKLRRLYPETVVRDRSAHRVGVTVIER